MLRVSCFTIPDPWLHPAPLFMITSSKNKVFESIPNRIWSNHASIKSGGGFTLTEILLAVGLLVILFAFTVPVYQSFQVKNDLDIAATTLAQSLRRAGLLSRGAKGDSSWGVKAFPGSFVIFRGGSYALRDPSFDELNELPESLALSGLSEVVFSKLTGNPNQIGSFTITASTGDTKNISLNPKGIVSY